MVNNSDRKSSRRRALLPAGEPVVVILLQPVEACFQVRRVLSTSSCMSAVSCSDLLADNLDLFIQATGRFFTEGVVWSEAVLATA